MLSTAKYNFHDYFIILIIASTIIGTAQIGLISHAFVVGLLCLPLILLEIVSSFRKGKMQPIVLFITIWIVYALLSVTWAPKHEYLLREIWKLSWNIVIFIGALVLMFINNYIFAAVTYMNLNSYVTLLCMALPFLVYGTSILQKKMDINISYHRKLLYIIRERITWRTDVSCYRFYHINNILS